MKKPKMRMPSEIEAAVLSAVNANRIHFERWLVLMSIEEAVESLGAKAPVPGTIEGGEWDRPLVEDLLTDALLLLKATEHKTKIGQPCDHGLTALSKLIEAFRVCGAGAHPAATA